MQADLESTRQKLEAEDFVLNDIQDKISEKKAHGVGCHAPSYGLFKTSLSPICFCGMPRNVKAIQLAAAEGQKIWTITQGSLDQALASIELSDDVETDIRNSVYAGKEVTAHERPVNFFGSQSSGYIVLDPYSGALAAGVISGFIAYLNGFLSTFLLAVAFSFIDPLVVAALIVMFSMFMNMINEMLIAMATTGCAAARGGR